ncbi:hypothetical protein BFP72_04645 [Reichenbachiella sp. 5M10]|uniref:hypothetical protein n=1 Tax=Reichenbachiella sp. 5M10 TaxID=1889772 RepID=UPI000C14C5EC|nr:hypothetical protein [Reichenbachiella sp. 5M10]PIB34745.1 hypothetical protein BFP72_04645 [Reichenbachiella sp. 5M10]
MKIQITAGDVMEPSNWKELVSMVSSRAIDAKEFRINMEKCKKIDLAQFNALVMLYVKLRRQHREVKYTNCSHPSIQKFIQKTQFDHVFSN